jgi:hypothetical protein
MPEMPVTQRLNILVTPAAGIKSIVFTEADPDNKIQLI